MNSMPMLVPPTQAHVGPTTLTQTSNYKSKQFSTNSYQKKKNMLEEKARTQGVEEEDGRLEEETMACPSFRNFSTTALKPPSSFSSSADFDRDYQLPNFDFEFSPFVSRNPSNHHPSYPVFGEEKKIMNVVDESDDCDSDSDSSEDDDLDGVPPDTYCVWRPGGNGSAKVDSAKVIKKCKSMGSSFWRRWSFRDLVFGRSRSDGKQKFLFLPTILAPATKTMAAKAVVVKEKKGKCGGGGVRGMEYYRKDGDRRRASFLPYRTDLVGFFPAGRNLRPFL